MLVECNFRCLDEVAVYFSMRGICNASWVALIGSIVESFEGWESPFG